MSRSVFCILSLSLLYLEIPQLHTNNITHSNFSWSVVKLWYFIQQPFHKRPAMLTLKLIAKHDGNVTWANIRALYVLSIAYMLFTLTQKSVKPYCDIVYLLATRLNHTVILCICWPQDWSLLSMDLTGRCKHQDGIPILLWYDNQLQLVWGVGCCRFFGGCRVLFVYHTTQNVPQMLNGNKLQPQTCHVCFRQT